MRYNSADRNLRKGEGQGMDLEYKRAAEEDIELLTKTRLEVLRAANKLEAHVDMGEVEEQSCQYYKKALGDGTHIAYLIFEGSQFVGTGGVSFYQVMPTWHNPDGKKAYIMNMYTAPRYRRRGIAYRMLDILVEDARERGVDAISLEATDMGRGLYEKYGFVKMENEMELLH